MKNIRRKSAVLIVIGLFIGVCSFPILAIENEDNHIKDNIYVKSNKVDSLMWYPGFYCYIGSVKNYNDNPNNITFDFTGISFGWIYPDFYSNSFPMVGPFFKIYFNQNIRWDKPLVTHYGKTDPRFICCIFFA